MIFQLIKEMNSFEHLDVWQEARKFVVSVYQLQARFPSYERFGLCDQIRRAVVSIPSNIAERSGRRSMKDKIRFVEYAYGSLMEVYCQLILANDLGYIDDGTLQDIKLHKDHIAKMLSGLHASYERQLNNSKP